MANQSLVGKVKLLAGLCLVLLAVHAVNVHLNGFLNNFGILPRNIYSLPHIFTGVFLHGSWGHLFNNIFGLVVFGGLCLLRGKSFFIKSSLFIVAFTGLAIWVFGRPAMHIGASGWIFGLWSLSIALAWFQRSFLNICIAVFVVFFYGGMLYGILPTDASVSFEAHFFGAIMGVIYAWLVARGKVSRARG